MNLAIREFQTAIRSYIQNNPLPEEVKRIALQEIVREVSEAADAQILKELNEKDLAKTEGKESAEHAESI